MRAVAVIAVIAFHIRVPWVSGGFVGVDVFFVVSGFLITRLILGELAASGTVSLRNFWGRRARRSAAGLDAHRHRHGAVRPAHAAAVVDAVVGHRCDRRRARSRPTSCLPTGSATTSGPSSVRPTRRRCCITGRWRSRSSSTCAGRSLLVLLTRRPQQYRRLVLAMISVLATASFVVAMWWTARRPSWAFFLLPARMGELLAGAALAVVGTGIAAIPATWRAALGWAGVLGIRRRLCGLRRHDPVARCCGARSPWWRRWRVIVGGTTNAPAWAPATGLAVAPLQWVGRHSYALYLWHWPALVLAEAEWGPLSWPQRFAAIGVAVGASALSVRLVEDPVRHSRYLSAVSMRSLALGGAMCVLVIGIGLDLRTSTIRLDGGVEAAAPSLGAVTTVTPSGIAAHRLPLRPSTTVAVATSVDPVDDAGDPGPAERPARPARRLDAADAAPVVGVVPRAVQPPALAGVGPRSVGAVPGRLCEHRRQRPAATVRVRDAERRRNDPAVRRLARRAVVRAARADRPPTGLPVGDLGQGWMPGCRGRRADSGVCTSPARPIATGRSPGSRTTNPTSSSSATRTRSIRRMPKSGPRAPRRRSNGWPRHRRTSC